MNISIILKTLTFLSLYPAIFPFRLVSNQDAINNLNKGLTCRFQNNFKMVSDVSFLAATDQTDYIRGCLRRSMDCCKICLKENKNYIEIEFPASRKSDLSVTETLDINRYFARELVKIWADLGKDLWVIFPDSSESILAKKSAGYGDNVPFTITSINGAISALQKDIPTPKLIVVVNPGFNVEEWIDIPKINPTNNIPIIIINGNLDRLRNGYYPRIFYPGLYKVTNEFYSKFISAFYLRHFQKLLNSLYSSFNTNLLLFLAACSPIAVGGSRLGAWLSRIYPDNWTLVVKNSQNDKYEIVSTSEREPNSQEAWKEAKKAFVDRGGRNF